MGILYVVSTPIGNLDDITLRAIKILSSVDLVLCEDTRHTGLFLQKFNISAKLVSYYDEIEDKKIPEIIEQLGQGKIFALVSDAGTPLISDPGFRLVRECIKRGITVESIPGPSALLAALTSSGLPPDKFVFLGYPPEKQSRRIELFSNLYQCFKTLKQSTTVIFYCAPHKLATTLTDMKTALGDIEIVVARELTKIHEEIWRGNITNAQNYFKTPKGEFVLIFNILQE
ncbi:MAG: 16S rRNA (cytidine(1402)-2'-O)-methyltransferase [Candidatus Gottesmanbacteria bacterium]|nr:16S rRNA (cytidine(1402)-2'-O)-methyltransferase [Candidatus Gottesmanbacteria bacterium]